MCQHHSTLVNRTGPHTCIETATVNKRGFGHRQSDDRCLDQRTVAAVVTRADDHDEKESGNMCMHVIASSHIPLMHTHTHAHTHL
jgi:hypothetical protein